MTEQGQILLDDIFLGFFLVGRHSLSSEFRPSTATE